MAIATGLECWLAGMAEVRVPSLFSFLWVAGVHGVLTPRHPTKQTARCAGCHMAAHLCHMRVWAWVPRAVRLHPP